MTVAIPARTRAHILARLAAVEAEQGVRVLFAAESGSRAWGFASLDSDFDVRFVYAHPQSWYMSLSPERDVIEGALDDHLVDLAGWDIRKALNLALKSNPAFYEWLVSPVVYRDDGYFRSVAQRFFEQHADPSALEHHYLSIARTQWRSEIDHRETPKLKRYFYVVRPLMALQWVQAKHDGPNRFPPMALSDLMAGVDVPSAVRAAISELIEAKRSTPELGTGQRIAVIDDWVRQRLEAVTPGGRMPIDMTAARVDATALFHRLIGFA